MLKITRTQEGKSKKSYVFTKTLEEAKTEIKKDIEKLEAQAWQQLGMIDSRTEEQENNVKFIIDPVLMFYNKIIFNYVITGKEG